MTANALIAPSNPTLTEELPRTTSPINVPMAMARPDARGLLVTIPRFLPTQVVLANTKFQRRGRRVIDWQMLEQI
jgi:hypothetical protein